MHFSLSNITHIKCLWVHVTQISNETVYSKIKILGNSQSCTEDIIFIVERNLFVKKVKYNS